MKSDEPNPLKSTLYAILTAWPFLYIPIAVLSGLLLALIMPYLTGAYRY